MPLIRTLCSLVILVLLASCGGPGTGPTTAKPRGWDVGGGGSAYAAEFKDIGRTVVRRLKGKGVSEVAGISFASFESTLEKAAIEPTEAALKKGEVSVDALNFPAQARIQLSLVHWPQSMDFTQKRKLVIHEVLGLMGKDDTGYRLTARVLETLGSQRVYFNKFEIHGEVAKTLIEKTPWQPNEIVTEPEPAWHATRYKIPFDSKEPDIECSKVEYVEPFRDNERTDIRCKVRKHAFLGEDGILHVSLVEEDGDHALWRLFDSINATRFDYGVIRGDRTKLLFTLEFFL